MTMNVLETVKKLAPHARSNYLEAIRQGGPLFEQHGITTPLRMAPLSISGPTRVGRLFVPAREHELL